ncbi:FAD-binding protein [Paeniglutamicibacter antarcticus]|uniref:FAD-binding protein n=1 Tax=Arthrobacter terrae TaxID=2935737 RepID=A0A931CV81_9MICC|nr:FAD-binding protein [Arthrobacter terrae]MBG0740498.1 FAD-binding protein [Arthrobacter terrae]
MSHEQQSIADRLARQLHDVTVLRRGSEEYRLSTMPENSSVVQEPLVVVRPDSAAALAKTIAATGRLGVHIEVQSTGHGAGYDLGPDTLLIDTRDLRRIDVDAAAGVARVGAGVVWSEVQSAASPHGLLG